ncbi:hypothetical protein [Pedobacter antarcticus]|uniref:hypothetical protein n=1 Tax=Pedobacter antarcticus TaxID=34086 RepID=UPI00293142F1|nr:hypothetical protein [Pedobacter antarcticus]
MGYTSIVVVNMLYQYIKHSELMTSANRPKGTLCKYDRPLNSMTEDIVINGLPLIKDDVDEAVLNVNIYVPNFVFPNNQADKSQADTARLLVLSNLGNQAFKDGEEIWDETGEYCFKYQQDTVMPDKNNQHYLNFRIEFYSIN